jgi:curli production assembly/transport component CsgG
MRNTVSAIALMASLLGGCAYPGELMSQAPSSTEVGQSYSELRSLPAPDAAMVVAVYDFPDLTGQYKPSEVVASYSRAVTQGGAMILIKALRDAGQGQWFRLIERKGLDHLAKERQIIREMRAAYAGGQPVQQLPPVLYAGMIIEGGIVGFDANTLTGGIGARYLGIGGSSEYRQDSVTVYANIVSTQTGEIMKTVMARKTIFSVQLQSGVFKFLDFNDLLEAEAGFSINEPGQIAMQQAIEQLVRSLIIEGAVEGLWRFQDEAAGNAAIARYMADKGATQLVSAQ